MGRTCEGSGAGLPVRPHERGDRSCGLPGRLLSHTSKPPSSTTPHPSQNKLLFKPTPGTPSASCYFCSGSLREGSWPWGELPRPQVPQYSTIDTEHLAPVQIMWWRFGLTEVLWCFTCTCWFGELRVIAPMGNAYMASMCGGGTCGASGDKDLLRCPSDGSVGCAASGIHKGLRR